MEKGKRGSALSRLDGLVEDTAVTRGTWERIQEISGDDTSTPSPREYAARQIADTLRRRAEADDLSESSLDPNWKESAACRDANPDIFYPVNTSKKSTREELVAAALTYCQACTVWRECLRFALENKIEDGVYGGMDEPERKNYREKWLRQKHAS